MQRGGLGFEPRPGEGLHPDFAGICLCLLLSSVSPLLRSLVTCCHLPFLPLNSAPVNFVFLSSLSLLSPSLSGPCFYFCLLCLCFLTLCFPLNLYSHSWPACQPCSLAIRVSASFVSFLFVPLLTGFVWAGQGRLARTSEPCKVTHDPVKLPALVTFSVTRLQSSLNSDRCRPT